MRIEKVNRQRETDGARKVMNQLGQIFRETRARLNKTLDDVSKETKIAKKYLLAIENEDFDVFPGETYLIGFMRNYSQFLGLDADEMILKYRDYKIQEQPAPIEQLTARPKNAKKFMLLAVVVLIFLAFVIYLATGGKRKEERRIAKKAVEKAVDKRGGTEKQKGRIVSLDEEEVIRDFKKNDVIEILHKNTRYQISIDDIGENLNFSVGNIPFAVSTKEKVEIDFDRDGKKDLFIKANVLSGEGANITLKKIYRPDLGGSEPGVSRPRDEAAQAQPPGLPEIVIIKEDDSASKIPIAPATGFKIVSGYEKTEISASVRSNATTYFSYVADRGEKKEKLLRNGEELFLNAREELKLMVANAQGISLEINKVSVTLGERGEVVAKLVKWYRDKDTKDLYHLIIDALEN